MEKSLFISFFLLFLVSLSAQEKFGILANPSGVLYDRPVYVELERLLTPKVSLGLRFSYLQFNKTRMDLYTLQTENDSSYAWHYEATGPGIGLHPKYYPIGDGTLKGIYLSIGADMYFGDFRYEHSLTGPSVMFEEIYDERKFVSTSFQVGYKLKLSKLILDFSFSRIEDPIWSSWIGRINRFKLDPPNFEKFFPSLAVQLALF